MWLFVVFPPFSTLVRHSFLHHLLMVKNFGHVSSQWIVFTFYHISLFKLSCYLFFFLLRTLFSAILHQLSYDYAQLSFYCSVLLSNKRALWHVHIIKLRAKVTVHFTQYSQCVKFFFFKKWKVSISYCIPCCIYLLLHGLFVKLHFFVT